MRSILFRAKPRLRPQRAVCALATASLLALVIGCGGGGASGVPTGPGGGVNNDKTISGSNVDVAVGVTVAKSTDASAVPFAVLNAVNPAGATAFNRPLTSGPTYVPGLKLYASSKVSGKTLSLNFYSDAAGKTSAGSVTVVGSENIGSAYTYPVSFHATGTITGGSIPLSADFTIVFSDSKGANSLNGTVTLTSDGISLTFNMTLDDSGNVGSGGTIESTYKYNYKGLLIPISTTMTNLTGGPATKIDGTATVDAAVPPLSDQQGTGTGILDLVNGNFTLNITGGALQGLLAAFNGGSDSLSVSTGAGLNDVITGASTFSLASLLTATSSGGSSYQAPIVVQGSGRVNVEQTLGDGEMVGFALDASSRTSGYYWPSPTSAPQTLPAPAGGSHTSAHGIANYSGQTVIVGSYDDASGTVQPCFWIDTSGTHVFKPYTASGTLPYGGEFQAISANGNTIVGYSYSQSFVQSPIAYISGSLYSLVTDGRTTNLRAVAVDNNNDILGAGDGSSPKPGIWSNVSVDSNTNKIGATFQSLPDTNGIGGSVQAFHMSDNGVVVGGDGLNGLYWQRTEGFAPQVLPIGSNAGSNAYAVNHSGTQAAGSLFPASPSTVSDLSYWATLGGPPVDVTKALGNLVGSYQNLAGFFILNDGSLIAIGTQPSSTSPQFVYIQKK